MGGEGEGSGRKTFKDRIEVLNIAV